MAIRPLVTRWAEIKQTRVKMSAFSLQNMFDTQEKESLFTEIDELIFSEDLPVYNGLVFQTGQLVERFKNKNQGMVNPQVKMKSHFESFMIQL